MLSDLMPGESTGFGDGDRTGAVIFGGESVAIGAVAADENFDDKDESHDDPFRAGDGDRCWRFCTDRVLSADEILSFRGREGTDRGGEFPGAFGPGRFAIVGEVFDVLLFGVASLELLAGLSLRP